MAQPVNPYVAGAPVQGKRFFGRQDTLDWVARGLRNPGANSVVLFGQRRIGKTTLLLQLRRTLPASAFVPIYFDLHGQAARPLSQVLVDLADIVAEQARVESPKPELFDDRGLFFSRTFLPQVHTALGKDRRPVFLLDEFDVLDEATEEDLPPTAAIHSFRRLVRRVMSKDPRPAFVFAVGRRVDDLAVDFTASFKASLVREVWVLDRESAEAMVRHAEANQTLRFTDQAVARVLDLTSGHPCLTQLLCQQIWEQAYQEHPVTPPQIDVAEVEAAVPNTLETVDQAFVWLWDGLGLAEQIYAAGLAEAADEGESISEDHGLQVLSDHAARLRTREVELMAPRDLVRRRVLDLTGEQEHRFAIELFRRWVRKHRPLWDVKDALDRVDPLADELFGIGQEFFRRNQLKAAVRYFRDALAANPHHFHARLRLGETLLQLNQTSRAVAELERAYELDAGEARLLLARALVAQASAREKEGHENAALASCERALEISPSNQVAQRIRSAILLRRLEARARSHEAAEDWAKATAIYEQLVAQAPDRESREAWQAAFERCRKERLLARLFEEGREALRTKNWQRAQRAFAEVVHGRPDYGINKDKAAELLLQAVERKPARMRGLNLAIAHIVGLAAVAVVALYLLPRIQGGDTTANMAPLASPRSETVDLPPGVELPEDWQYIDTYRLDADYDNDLDWIVLYRFDLPANAESDGGPIAGVVYQQDGNSPPARYDLKPPDGDYLCECECEATLSEALSMLPDRELVVEDRCDGEITKASIFHWDSAAGRYLPKGNFSGSRVQVMEGHVIIDRRLPDRAQLALRQVYRPRNGQTYYQPGDLGILVTSEQYEYTFYQAEPRDVTRSPYPEKVVLGFYHHYSDGEGVSNYFTETGWEQLAQCTTGQCGCTAAPSEVAHVRVIDMRSKESTSADRAVFDFDIVCELQNERPEGETTVRWHLMQEDNGWKLHDAELISAE